MDFLYFSNALFENFSMQCSIPVCLLGSAFDVRACIFICSKIRKHLSVQQFTRDTNKKNSKCKPVDAGLLRALLLPTVQTITCDVFIDKRDLLSRFAHRSIHMYHIRETIPCRSEMFCDNWIKIHDTCGIRATFMIRIGEISSRSVKTDWFSKICESTVIYLHSVLVYLWMCTSFFLHVLWNIKA